MTNQVDKLQSEVLELRNLLIMWRDLVKESGVPRYTVIPGAALNTIVTWTDSALRRKA